jgi:hypothetical protein
MFRCVQTVVWSDERPKVSPRVTRIFATRHRVWYCRRRIQDWKKNTQKVSISETLGSPPVASIFILVGTYIWCISKNMSWKIVRIYYMFANMASLNRWRRVRGFSKSVIHFIEIMLMAYRHVRHFCFPTSLWRGWWYRPSNVRLSHFALDISWDFVAQSSCASIPFLSQTNRNSNEPIK